MLEQRLYDLPVYYWLQQPFSSRYYSEGKAVVVNDEDQLIRLQNTPYYIVVTQTQLTKYDSFATCKLEVETKKKVLMLCGES